MNNSMKDGFQIERGMGVMNCDKCVHKGICKNESIAREAEKKVADFRKDNDIPGWLVFSIICKTFELKWGNRRSTEVNKEDAVREVK